MKQANWADSGKPGYRTEQKPVGKDRKQVEGPLPTNDDFPQTWTDVKGKRVAQDPSKTCIECGATLPFIDPRRLCRKCQKKEGKRVLCAADVIPLDPSKRRLKTQPPMQQSQTPQRTMQPEPGVDDPYNAITMAIDYALEDLANARNMARDAGEHALAARIESAIKKAYAELRYE